LITVSIICFVVAFGFLICVARIRIHRLRNRIREAVTESRLPPHTHPTGYQVVSSLKKQEQHSSYGTLP
jgi:hypothetical protein